MRSEEKVQQMIFTSINRLAHESQFVWRNGIQRPPSARQRWQLLNGRIMHEHSPPMGGTSNARFDALDDRRAAKLARAAEKGVSLALSVEGEMMVDQRGSWTDDGHTVSTENTITTVLSATKTASALAALTPCS